MPWLALLVVSQAWMALSVDPYFEAHPGGTLNLPRRGPLVVLVGLQLVLGLALFFRRLPHAVVRAAWLVLGASVLVASCPFNRPEVHVLQVLLLLAGGALLVRESWRNERRWAVRSLLVVLVLLASEGAFGFVARSHAVGYTLASRLWFERHWNDVANSKGYRDVEHPDDGRPRLFVLGDSFVSGVGIADVAERFSDRLQARFPELQVHNIGWNGADTRAAHNCLLEYPGRPDILVLSYYVNDIEGAAAELGLGRPTFRPYSNLPHSLRLLVSRSYLLDFFYWQLPQQDLSGLGDHLARSFARPDVVARQQRQLEALVEEGRGLGATVLAVVFPDLHRAADRPEWVEPALAVFRARGVPFVDVRELLRGHEPAEVVVNRNDAHPSAWLHARVAEALAPLVQTALDSLHERATAPER